MVSTWLSGLIREDLRHSDGPGPQLSMTPVHKKSILGLWLTEDCTPHGGRRKRACLWDQYLELSSGSLYLGPFSSKNFVQFPQSLSSDPTTSKGLQGPKQLTVTDCQGQGSPVFSTSCDIPAR
jgi:hypothetical protein